MNTLESVKIIQFYIYI